MALPFHHYNDSAFHSDRPICISVNSPFINLNFHDVRSLWAAFVFLIKPSGPEGATKDENFANAWGWLVIPDSVPEGTTPPLPARRAYRPEGRAKAGIQGKESP